MQDILLRENEIDREKEHFWMMGLTASNKLQYIELVSLGSVTATMVEPMNVFRIAVMKGSVKVILVHNHPGGELQPSHEDKDLTDRLIQVGHILNILVIDHLIISEESFYSFTKTGLLAELELSTIWVPQFELIERIKKEEKKIRAEAVKAAEEKARRIEKVEMAKNSLKEGLSIELISKLTGLSKPEIEKLKTK
jgi:DNA repair protein RadC